MGITIYDISNKSNVSIATVSRVLNGSTKVKTKTRQKVLDAIHECGYTPNAFARGLGLNSMNTIGLMCADSSDLYLAKAIFYIEQNLRVKGYNSILCCTGYDIEPKKAALKLLLSKRVDSIVMIGSSYVELNDADNEYIRQAANQIPIMLLNADFDYPNVYCTLCDDFKGMMTATDYLLGNNLDYILYLYNANTYSSLRKLNGYQTSLLQSGKEPKPEYQALYSGSKEDLDSIASFIEKFIQSNNITVNAILCSDDILAQGAYKYLKKNNLKIPEDVSVIGYNNSLLAHCNSPELTSVDNKLEALCDQLSKTLVSVLDDTDMPLKTILSGELVYRDSTPNIK